MARLMQRMAPGAALLAVSLSACVIPVRPEFDDPEPNTAPYVRLANPPEFSTVTAVAGQNATFSVVVSDPNAGDKLYFRWMIDYPPFDPVITRRFDFPPLPNVPDVGTQAQFAPNCSEHFIAPGRSTHKILLIVADRPFDGFDNVEALKDNDGRIRKVGWILDKFECGTSGSAQ